MCLCVTVSMYVSKYVSRCLCVKVCIRMCFVFVLNSKLILHPNRDDFEFATSSGPSFASSSRSSSVLWSLISWVEFWVEF